MTTGQDARRTPPLSLWRRSFTGAALWLLLWLTGLPVAHAAVAQLGSPTSLYQSTAGASHSLGSVTVPAGNQRVLIVTASHTGYVDVASVSFGGTAMTKAVERDDGSVAVDSVWFLALGNSASSTSGNVVAQFAMPTTTTATPPRESFLSATTFSGVDQATPISATNAANNPGGANLGSSLTLASAAGDLALDLFDGFRSTGAVTPSVVAGQTLLTSGGGAITGTSPGQSGYRVSTKPGAAPNVTLGWTSNAEAMIHVAVNLRASASVPVSAPTVAAPTATAVTPNSATLGGNVTADGGATITGRGVVYAPTAANSDPLIGGASVTNLTTAGTTGVFTLNASGLTPNTAYSFKAYATNASGTGYTNVGTFTTQSLPTLTLTKLSIGGVGSFDFTGSNGWSSQSITTTTAGVGVTGMTQTLAAAGTSTTITETVPPGFILTGVTCTGLGNGGSATLSGNTLTLDAAATVPGANIACTFTNTKLPTLRLTKVSNGGVGTFTFTGNNGWSSQSITTTTAGAGVAGLTQTLAAAGASTTITETVPPGFILTGVSCTGLGSGGTATLSGNAVILNSSATAAGSNIACTFTNAKLPTLTLIKVSNGGVGTFDFAGTNGLSLQSITTLTPGVGVSGATQTLAAAATVTFITENVPPAFALTAVSCTGLGSGSVTRSGNLVALDTFATVPGANIVCTFTNTAVNPPTVSTPTVTDVTTNSATLGGNVTADGGGLISARGIVLSPTATNNDPLIGGPGVTNLTTSGTTGVFTLNATGLTPSTAYSFKAYATNGAGTVYTSVGSFTTCGAIVVSNGNDSGAGSLRQAIADACAGSTITFASGVTASNLTTAELVIDKNLTINGGTGVTVTRVAGSPNFRIFRIASGTVAISGLTISNGNTTDFGGGIRNSGALTLTDCVITGNSALTGFGGGIFSQAPMVIDGCTISGNQAGNAGGLFHGFNTLTLRNTTVSNNTTEFQGGGVSIQDATATLANCTISGNRSNSSQAAISHLVSSRPASLLTITNCTVTDNVGAAQGFGGIWTGYFTETPGRTLVTQLSNTLVSNNFPDNFTTTTGTANIRVPTPNPFLTSLGHNLDSDGSSGFVNGSNGDLVGTVATPINALLAPLGSFGGRTQTHALLPGSPAVNAGSNAVCAAAPVGGLDQRGIARPQLSSCDIGAFESRGYTLAIEGGNNQVTGPGLAFAQPLAVRVAPVAAGEPVAGGAVSFTAPGSGASATLASNPASINVSGVASTLATANASTGSYTVSATANGASAGVDFALRNAAATVSVNDVTVVEGDTGSVNAVFTVTRSNRDTAFSVNVATAAGTATSGTDFTAVSETLSFAAGPSEPLSQTVTVPVIGDRIDEANEQYTVSLSGLVQTAGTTTIGTATGIGTITDDDVAGITVTPTAGLTTTEAGGTATFTVVLNTQPTADVSIGLSSNDATEGTVSPTSLSFTTANWNVARTVTVTGVDDVIVDGNIGYTILTAAATSTDPNYAGLDPANVGVSNTDNDEAGVILVESGGATTVTEGGATDTYTLVLTSQPTANVVIAVNPNAQLTTAPTSVTFTAANWNVAQTVTVSAVDDAVAEGSHSGTVSHAVTSGDAGYNGQTVAGVTATITDNDNAGVVVTPSGGNTAVAEGGATDSYTLVLTSQPTANVVVAITPNAQLTTAPTSVTFTSANWNVAQTVTLSAVDDAVAEGSHSGSVAHAVSSADASYNGIDVVGVTATITDNDNAGVTVTQSGGNTAVTEGGATDTYTLVLTSQPTANVAVAITPNAQLTTAPTSVIFTSANWNVAQTVTVSAVDDAVAEGSHSGSVAHT
ncbi:MAG: hypothetical protein MUE46_08265, partial [Xanthomonadales bacterium]|nr:hypothetical protein [Xanthomonadales bacterium]